jgi:hypothetical protein
MQDAKFSISKVLFDKINASVREAKSNDSTITEYHKQDRVMCDSMAYGVLLHKLDTGINDFFYGEKNRKYKLSADDGLRFIKDKFAMEEKIEKCRSEYYDEILQSFYSEDSERTRKNIDDLQAIIGKIFVFVDKEQYTPFNVNIIKSCFKLQRQGLSIDLKIENIRKKLEELNVLKIAAIANKVIITSSEKNQSASLSKSFEDFFNKKIDEYSKSLKSFVDEKRKCESVLTETIANLSFLDDAKFRESYSKLSDYFRVPVTIAEPGKTVAESPWYVSKLEGLIKNLVWLGFIDMSKHLTETLSAAYSICYVTVGFAKKTMPSFVVYAIFNVIGYGAATSLGAAFIAFGLYDVYSNFDNINQYVSSSV